MYAAHQLTARTHEGKEHLCAVDTVPEQAGIVIERPISHRRTHNQVHYRSWIEDVKSYDVRIFGAFVAVASAASYM
jgi:hypothetical protein